MEDQSIVELYLARNERAVSESELKYGSYCTRIALNILRNREDSEESVSDTWLAAWNTIPPTVPKILRAFFAKIVRNISLKKWEMLHAGKRGGGEVPLVLDELSECVADERILGWSAESDVIRDVLNAFLRELPEESRRLFVSRYFDMDSVKQIASDYALGESKVKMTLLRARGQLREYLIREGIEV